MDELSWFTKFGPIGGVMAGIIILCILEVLGRFYNEDGVGPISGIIQSLRSPRQIISTNICPKCQKSNTETITP